MVQNFDEERLAKENEDSIAQSSHNNLDRRQRARVIHTKFRARIPATKTPGEFGGEQTCGNHVGIT